MVDTAPYLRHLVVPEARNELKNNLRDISISADYTYCFYLHYNCWYYFIYNRQIKSKSALQAFNFYP